MRIKVKDNYPLINVRGCHGDATGFEPNYIQATIEMRAGHRAPFRFKPDEVELIPESEVEQDERRTVADVLADIDANDRALEQKPVGTRRGQFKRERRLLNELVEVSKRDQSNDVAWWGKRGVTPGHPT